MKVPTDFKIKLAKGIIDESMLEACLVAVNKRAKNARNSIRRLSQDDFLRYVKTKEKHARQLRNYYEMKYDFLRLLEPIAIHKEVYAGKVDARTCGYTDGGQQRCGFYDATTNTTTFYYLFFKTAHHSYHFPISQDRFEYYSKQLPIEDIQQHIQTNGLNEEDMLPMEFVMQVHALIRNWNGVKFNTLGVC